jgi:hypothetical protein
MSSTGANRCRRRLYALYRRAAWLDTLIAKKWHRGEEDHHLNAERAGLRWALDELADKYPEEAKQANDAVKRDLEKQR